MDDDTFFDFTFYDESTRSEKPTNWYDGRLFVEIFDGDCKPESVYKAAKVILTDQSFIDRGEILCVEADDGFPSLKGTHEKLIRFLLEDLGAWVGLTRYWQGTFEIQDRIFIWNDGCCRIIFPQIDVPGVDDEDDDEDIYYDFVTRSSGDMDGWKKILIDGKASERPYVHRDPGTAYVMADIPRQGIQIIPLGLAGEDLIRDNYEEDVLTAFDLAVEDFKKDNPVGRLVVLEGEPGGGKTHMVQAMMLACPQSKFVVVSPKLLPDLEDPGFILTYVNQLDVTKSAPLILVLDDADACLTERNVSNMSSISAILNLSDGIIGKLLNIRILATSNTKLGGSSFDSATLRDGRLSQHIKIGRLSAQRAAHAWGKIVGDPLLSPNFNEPMTLASVYKNAKQWLEKNQTSPTKETLSDLDGLKKSR